MKKTAKIFLALLLTFILGAMSLLSACGEDQGGGGSGDDETPIVKDEYTVTFDLNYEGSTPRNVKVKAGTRVSNWNTVRSSYTLGGWFTDQECSADKKYNFSDYVNSDFTLYALWIKDAEQFAVTFDFNYPAAESPAIVSVSEGSTILSMQVPACPRLGYQYEGWYRDEDCSPDQKWDFSSDAVEGPITLYAKYKADESIARDADGNIMYDNIAINIWTNAPGFGTNTTSNKALGQLISKFNRSHPGEITVNLITDVENNQTTTALRLQQVANVLEEVTSNYYSADAVFDLAGIEFDDSAYYTEAVRDCYLGGTMYSVPIVSSVPYLIYNKELMTKYNGSNALPANNTEWRALLGKAYTGESVTNENFRTAVTGVEWMYKEGPSMTAFFQNNARYLQYDTAAGKYVNNWGQEGSDGFQRALTAYTNTYDLFANMGPLHGREVGVDYNDKDVISWVTKGDALIGLCSYMPSSIGAVSAEFAKADSKIGVTPVSGLFSDLEDYKDLIPAMNIGLQFYKASNLSLTQLAACAVFAEYMAENSGEFAAGGWYPVRKSLAESEDFTNGTSPMLKLLQAAGQVSDFVTHDGYVNLKAIFNKTVAETFLVPDITKTTVLTPEDLVQRIVDIESAISANL